MKLIMKKLGKFDDAKLIFTFIINFCLQNCQSVYNKNIRLKYTSIRKENKT